MKMNAYIAGTGMTDFGKFLERPLSSLTVEAMEEALKDAGIEGNDLQAAWMGNAAAGATIGQVCVPGQIALRRIGIGKIPVVNVENACASSSTAVHQAAAMVTAGAYDIVLATGFEKLYSTDKATTFRVFGGAIDVEEAAEVMKALEENAKKQGAKDGVKGAGENRSIFMDIYASAARSYMARYGATVEHFAEITAKNSLHGSMNPHAQFKDRMTVEEVLAGRMVSDPLRLAMCSPIGDGAAATVIMSERKVRELGIKDPVKVEAAVLASGWDRTEGDNESVPAYAARTAYEFAGIGPEDIDVIELHDATSPAELICYEQLGICKPEDAIKLVEDGDTTLGGRIPVNTSGGLARKGHPIGATGAAQIVELAQQLRGRCGDRQVEGAKVGVAENGGAFIKGDVAALTVTVLSV